MNKKTHSKEYFQAYRESNRLRIRERQRRWYLSNKEKAKASWDKYVASGKEATTRRKRMSTATYKNRALERANVFKEKDPNRYRTHQRHYQSKRRLLGGALCERDLVINVYANCPDNLEVDHIIPLKHTDVCGLHVPWNMQYLSRSQNAKKSNSFDFTYENKSWNKQTQSSSNFRHSFYASDARNSI